MLYMALEQQEGSPNKRPLKTNSVFKICVECFLQTEFSVPKTKEQFVKTIVSAK